MTTITKITACSVCLEELTNEATCTSCSNIEAENKEYAEAFESEMIEADRKAESGINIILDK